MCRELCVRMNFILIYNMSGITVVISIIFGKCPFGSFKLEESFDCTRHGRVFVVRVERRSKTTGTYRPDGGRSGFRNSFSLVFVDAGRTTVQSKYMPRNVYGCYPVVAKSWPAINLGKQSRRFVPLRAKPSVFGLI